MERLHIDLIDILCDLNYYNDKEKLEWKIQSIKDSYINIVYRNNVNCLTIKNMNEIDSLETGKLTSILKRKKNTPKLTKITTNNLDQILNEDKILFE